MQTLTTFGLGRGWCRRMFDRNPLVRTSDRIESVATALAVTIVMLAAAVSLAVGTSVRDSHAQTYAEQARTRHAVIATATADSRADTSYGAVVSIAQAKWNVDGIERTGEFEWPESLAAGQQIQIWVDQDGQRVREPAPQGQASMDAVMVAGSLWLGVVMVAMCLVRLLRGRLDRRRYAQWDQELHHLCDNDGGRASR